MLRALGQGHFGAVWLAEGQLPRQGRRAARRQRVAIKQLRGEWSMRAFETLVHEFELLERVKHRSLCKVYEFLDREMAVVMELVEGVTLRRVLEALHDRGETVWPEAALEIGCELADCLYQAHATPGPDGEPLSLVHRDIKPANVMLTPTGEVKLLDFGLAAIAQDSEPGVAGTPVYMAPEQARGEGVDHRTDLFAVGLLLYELLTGDPVYPVPEGERESAVDALMERIEAAQIQPEIQEGLRLLPRLSQVVARTLHSDPDQRPADGHVLMVALRQCRGPEDRGALAEFCAYAFGPDGPLAESAPADVPSGSGAPDGGARGPAPRDRMGSERTNPGRQPMANNPNNPRPGAPPRPGGNPRPTARRPPSRPAAGGRMWSPTEKTSKPPMVVDGDSPPQDLRMVPLVDEGDDEELGDGPPDGATQFFTRPKPVKAMETPPVSASPPPGPPPGAVPPGPVPPGFGAPGAGFGGPPIAQPPVGISGPVAQGPAPAAAVPGVQAPPIPQDGGRTQSYRVFAILLGLMMMVSSVLVVIVALTVYGVYWSSNQETAQRTPQVTAPAQAAPAPVDTGLPAGKPEPKPIVKPRSKPRPRSTTPKPAPPPAPTTTPGSVTISLAPGSPKFSSVEITCPSGFRKRIPFGAAGSATVPGVPREGCTAFFKGGPPAKTSISGGDSKTCSFNPTTVCN